jgi:hypothetical protein
VGESPIATLERWEAHGASWRLLELRDGRAVVELCTCYGEPVDRVDSDDPELLQLVRRRPSSEE